MENEEHLKILKRGAEGASARKVTVSKEGISRAHHPTIYV